MVFRLAQEQNIGRVSCDGLFRLCSCIITIHHQSINQRKDTMTHEMHRTCLKSLRPYDCQSYNNRRPIFAARSPLCDREPHDIAQGMVIWSATQSVGWCVQLPGEQTAFACPYCAKRWGWRRGICFCFIMTFVGSLVPVKGIHNAWPYREIFNNLFLLTLCKKFKDVPFLWLHDWTMHKGRSNTRKRTFDKINF